MVVAWKATFPGDVSSEYFILRASRILQVKNGTQQTRKLTEKDSHQLRRYRIRFSFEASKIAFFLMRKVIPRKKYTESQFDEVLLPQLKVCCVGVISVFSPRTIASVCVAFLSFF